MEIQVDMLQQDWTATIALLLLPVVLFGIGCDPSFDPLQENDRYFFSIYGYLDASADTQWVRIAPVRDSLNAIPEEIDATVTLEHLTSGEIAVMNDSLFEFFHGVRAHNFWTTMDLQPGETYRLGVEASDGRSSHATVTLPSDFPAPLLRIAYKAIEGRDVVYIEGAERLADVQVRYHYRPAAGRAPMYPVPHIQDTVRTSPSTYEVLVDPKFEEDYRERYFPAGIGGSFLYKEVFVAAAGPDWHPFATIDEKIIALPEGISNVENGVGYVAGIVSKTIPYVSCWDELGNFIGCPAEE